MYRNNVVVAVIFGSAHNPSTLFFFVRSPLYMITKCFGWHAYGTHAQLSSFICLLRVSYLFSLRMTLSGQKRRLAKMSRARPSLEWWAAAASSYRSSLIFCSSETYNQITGRILMIPSSPLWSKLVWFSLKNFFGFFELTNPITKLYTT